MRYSVFAVFLIGVSVFFLRVEGAAVPAEQSTHVASFVYDRDRAELSALAPSIDVINEEYKKSEGGGCVEGEESGFAQKLNEG
jgi:hypothetical protein